MGSRLNGYTLFRSKPEFDAFLDGAPSILERRRGWSRQLFEVSDVEDGVQAWCDACAGLCLLEAPGAGEEPDFRESLTCGQCGQNARSRMAADLSRRFLVARESAVPYATEQTSRYFQWLKQRYPKAIGSEYFEPEHRERLQDYLHGLLGPHETLRFEDVTALGLPDGSVDLVVSSDVLEHVPDHARALAEFRRVLRPGGQLVLTVPFGWDRGESIRRARIGTDGGVEHLVEPEYHGDPMNDSGVLAFHSFGWDLLDDVRAADFEDACWALAWRPTAMLLADLWVLIAGADAPLEREAGPAPG